MTNTTRATASSFYNFNTKTKEITQVWRNGNRFFYNVADDRYKEHVERVVTKPTSGGNFIAVHDTPASVTWFDSKTQTVTRSSKDGGVFVTYPSSSRNGRYLAGLAVRKGRITEV